MAILRQKAGYTSDQGCRHLLLPCAIQCPVLPTAQDPVWNLWSSPCAPSEVFSIYWNILRNMFSIYWKNFWRSTRRWPQVPNSILSSRRDFQLTRQERKGISAAPDARPRIECIGCIECGAKFLAILASELKIPELNIRKDFELIPGWVQTNSCQEQLEGYMVVGDAHDHLPFYSNPLNGCQTLTKKKHCLKP